LYQHFYENIPIARKLADSIRNSVWGNGYQIQGGRAQDQEKLDSLRQRNRFDELLRQMVFDTTVHGMGFLEIGFGSNPILTRLDPTVLEIHTEFVRRGQGAQGFTNEIQSVVLYRGNQQVREISYQQLIPIIGESLPGGSPLGGSVYGLWLHHWFLLKFSNQALINTHYMGRDWEVSELNALRIQAERSVTMGAMATLPEERKDSIKDDIERKVFPTILGEDFEAKDCWPELVWLA